MVKLHGGSAHYTVPVGKKFRNWKKSQRNLKSAKKLSSRLRSLALASRFAPNNINFVLTATNAAMACCRACCNPPTAQAATLRDARVSFSGLLVAVLGLLAAFLGHDYVSNQIVAGVKKYVVMSDEQAGGWPGFVNNQDPNAGKVISNYWFFNITNPREVLKGAKPIVEEIGPLTYLYVNTKYNISWERGRDEIIYKEYQRFIAM